MKKRLYFTLILLLANIVVITYNLNDTVSYSTNAKQAQSPVNPISIQSFENETLLAHNMDVRIQNDDSLKITSNFVLTNNDTLEQNSFLLIINRSINSIFCYDPLGTLEFSWEVNPEIGNIINVTLRYPLFPSDVYVFSVSYYIEEALYHVDGAIEYFGLDFEVIHPRNTERFILEICLPNRASLLSESPPDPVFPEADKVYLDNDIYKVSWELNDRNQNESDIFLLRYEFNENGSSNPSNLAPLYYVLTLLGGILVGAGGIYLFYRLKTKPSETELVTALLSNSEQEVIKAINTDGGVSTQRRICEKTGYSKSKVSQILAKLEEKKVLNRERWGRTNKVTITKDSFKNINVDPNSNSIDTE